MKEQTGGRFKGGFWFSLFLIAFVVLFLIESAGYARVPRAFPQLIGWITLILLVGDVVNRQLKVAKQPDAGGKKKELVNRSWLVTMLVGLVAFPILTWVFGFVVTSVITIAVIGWILSGRKKPVHSIVGAIGLTAVMYVIFQVGFQVELPLGIIIEKLW